MRTWVPTVPDTTVPPNGSVGGDETGAKLEGLAVAEFGAGEPVRLGGGTIAAVGQLFAVG